MGRRLQIANALLCLLMNVASLEIDTADGGYKNLLIAIHKDVPYNESIVTNLKELLQSSSEFLHRATNGRVYFKHVTIHLPNTWPKRSSAQPLSSSSFDRSDVRVELPGSVHEDRPFTKQARPCGQPGDFIQIPPAFLAELKGSTASKYINPAYVFVHEWAHYRYGVFDEYGSQDDDTYPLTYCVDGKVRLNSCSKNIRFVAMTANGERCTHLKDNCQFVKNCTVKIFAPRRDVIESSIMFMPYQSNISQFCDSSKGNRQHNQFAPNKHNRICNGKSTWDVIIENEDFQKVPRSDMSKRIRVSFDETQQKEVLPQRVVLVLDVSSSMNDNNRLVFLKEAAERYIRDIPDGTKRLAIVSFSTTAKVEHPLMPVNVNTRQGFLKAVKDLQTIYYTCIGCGLTKALEVLTTRDETPEGGVIVLMSDGGENKSPTIYDMKPKLIASKVVVSTMALGATADNKLEELAIETKAKSFALQDLQGKTASQMESAFVEATTSQTDEASGRINQVIAAEMTFRGRLKKEFTLERSLGNNTVVIVERVGTSVGPFVVWLFDPDGNKCQAQTCRESIAGKLQTISIPSPAKAGTWVLYVEASRSDEVEVNIQVKSQAKDLNDEPIRSFCRMASLKVAKPHQAIILTDVRKGKKIVLNAEVTAEVFRPKAPHKVTVRLSDDGKDPDIVANDGTYSAYFTAFNGKGRYAVTAHVTGHNKTRLVDPKPGSGSSFTTVSAMLTSTVDPDLDDDNEYSIDDFIIVNTTSEAENATSTAGQEVDAFQRVASGGSFQVTEDIQEAQVPPGDIRDLAVSEIRPEQNNILLVKLTWTWPGAHLTSGNASSINIRASKDDAKLKTDFEKQIEITTAHVVEGNLDPLPSGATHEVTLSLPKSFAAPRADGAVNWRAFLAARVFNSDGLNSTTSNIVPVSYTPPDVTTTVATTTVATTTQATTTEATTTEATTTMATTTVVTSTVATTTQPTTTEAATTTAPSTPSGADQGRQTSGHFTKLWMWILIGGIAAVVVIAIVVGVLIKRSSRNSRIYNFLVGRSQGRAEVPA
ncbi:calcium-activated chloride channel regulator 1-like [Amblyomma americanum]